MSTEFIVSEVTESKLDGVKEKLKEKGVVLKGDMLVLEGCSTDDKIILGGRNEFLSHFCTFFNFDACMAGSDGQALSGTRKVFSDSEVLDKRLNEFVRSFDT